MQGQPEARCASALRRLQDVSNTNFSTRTSSDGRRHTVQPTTTLLTLHLALTTSICVGALLFGLVLLFHFDPNASYEGLMANLIDVRWFIIGLAGAGVIASVFGWWGDVIKESRQGDHKPIVQLGLRYGMLFFIASEVMFFFAFFWAYFNFGVTEESWPPKGTEAFNPIDMPLYNTVILLLSGVTVTWAHNTAMATADYMISLGLTIVLGVLFTGMQAVEYIGLLRLRLRPGCRGRGAHLPIGVPDRDRLPRRARDHRDDLPGRVLVPGSGQQHHQGKALRLRSGGLVLALRRRSVAVPLRRSTGAFSTALRPAVVLPGPTGTLQGAVEFLK